jgi:hypothetical protein
MPSDSQPHHAYLVGKEGGETALTISIQLVVVLAVVVYIAYRFMGLRAWHALVCLLFGFFLAATSAAPEIRQIVSVIVRSLSR